MEQILSFVTLPGETALDQFAGSGVLGEAALKTGRNSILIEKDIESFEKITQRLAALGEIENLTPAGQIFVTAGQNAIVAQDAFIRTGDRDILYNFSKYHEMPEPAKIFQALNEITRDNHLTPEQQDAVNEAFNALEEVDLRSQDLDLSESGTERPQSEETLRTEDDAPKKVLECSSRGDRRFSAIFAKVTIKGREQSIEEWYQNAKRTEDGKKAGKGKPFAYIVDPYTSDKLPACEASNLYSGLWVAYLTKNPDLVAYAKGFDAFNDMFRSENTINCQADVIAAYVRDPDGFVKEVRSSHWYQNMASKKKPSLSNQIQFAESRASGQMNLFDERAHSVNHRDPLR